MREEVLLMNFGFPILQKLYGDLLVCSIFVCSKVGLSLAFKLTSRWYNHQCRL